MKKNISLALTMVAASLTLHRGAERPQASVEQLKADTRAGAPAAPPPFFALAHARGAGLCST